MEETTRLLPFRRPLPSDTERQELVEDLEAVRDQLHQAYEAFDRVSDPELVDAWVYEIKSLQSRYSYLMRRIKAHHA